jgi:hypothetical protein
MSGGLTDDAHFSIGMYQHNVPALYFLNHQTGVTVLVGDKYSNPVRTNTTIYFSTMAGVVDNNTAFTDRYGLASVRLISGAPWPEAGTIWAHPVYGKGYSLLKAATVDAFGSQISKETIFLFSGRASVRLSPASAGLFPDGKFHVKSGGRIVVEVDVTDEFGNPLAAGTTILPINDFTPPPLTTYQVKVSGLPPDPLGDNLGDPTPPTNNVIPGLTHFYVIITDATPGGTSFPWAGAAGVKVSHPWGNGTYTTYLTFSGIVGDTTSFGQYNIRQQTTWNQKTE